MMQRNGLRWRRLISGEDLHVGHGLLIADDESSDSGAANVIHLFETGLVENGSPLLTGLDTESRKENSTILASSFQHKLVMALHPLLEVDE